MKIVVKGKPEKRLPVRFVCEFCGCIFIADKTEYQIAQETILADCVEGYSKIESIYSCKCPCCDRTAMAREERKL